jgi:hypothetical protein
VYHKPEESGKLGDSELIKARTGQISEVKLPAMPTTGYMCGNWCRIRNYPYWWNYWIRDGIKGRIRSRQSKSPSFQAESII